MNCMKKCNQYYDFKKLKSKVWTDPGFCIFRSPNRFYFGISIEDFQEDGFIRLTLTVWRRAIQLVIPFVNCHRHKFDIHFKIS